MEEKNKLNEEVRFVPNNKDEDLGILQGRDLAELILEAAQSSQLNLPAISNFDSIARNREQIYTLLDTMSQDSMIASILEAYAEDSVEPNSSGKIFLPFFNTITSFFLPVINRNPSLSI